jgi:hypothetical protein
MDRIAVEGGAAGSLTFFGDDGDRHAMLIDHVFSEYRSRIENKKTRRTIDEWRERTNADNDYWDCLCGSTVAASIRGIRLDGLHQPPPPPPKHMSLDERKRRARAAQ